VGKNRLRKHSNDKGIWSACSVCCLLFAGIPARAEALKTSEPETPKDLGPIPSPTPVMAVDDTRTHGPNVPDYVDFEVQAQSILHRPDGGMLFTGQLAFPDPTSGNREVNDALKPYRQYELRVRGTFIRSQDENFAGPMSFGVQRHFPIAPFWLESLATIQAGVEAVVSTPWLSGRRVIPMGALQGSNGVDTELAQNGWSLRPVSTYIRIDYFAGRSFYLELGGAPELFVPALGPTEYDLRFHGAVGLALSRTGQVTSWSNWFKLCLEYVGRVRLYAADEPVAYWNSLGAALQLYQNAWFLVGVLATTDLGLGSYDHMFYGLRMQFSWPR